ncbi:MAG: hypothetical protein ACXWOL_17015 [Ktedonobacteraceae bacterium]
MHFKKLHIGSHELVMLALVIGATILRFILIRLNWPFTNSDEGTMDLMALHIAYRGEHPIFYYGQEYMGPLEAYNGEELFHIFGVSVFTVRLGLLPFFAFFLVCMYYLTSMLYTKKLALFTVGLLSLGSSDIIGHQLLAIGGYPEIVMFGALIFLLATWLALSSPEGPRRNRATSHASLPRRLLIYAFLGFVIGLALWIDQLILPIVAAAGLLLLLFCYREALWGGLCLIAGGAIGAFPLIIYNIHAPAGQNSLDVLLFLNRTGADKVVARHISLLQQWLDVFLISLPVATGANPCLRADDLPLLASPMDSLPCIALQSIWATGLTLLWGIAVLLACIALWQCWRRVSAQEEVFEKPQTAILHTARLLLLLSAALTYVLFARSPAAALYPVTSSRYLICILLAIPALLWPLWKGLHRLELPQMRQTWVMLICRVGILLLVGTTFLVGTVNTFGNIPHTQATYAREDALIRDLLRLRATRIYSEYWTCNRIIFASNERIICASLNEKLGPGFNRYLPYLDIVKTDPHPAYVFPLGSPQAMAFAEQHQSDTRYRRHVFEGYVVYQIDTSSKN